MGLDEIRRASEADAETIAVLVNAAYRPASGAYGWTHESALVAGERTNVGQVAELLGRRESVILVGVKDSAVVACVHVEKDGVAGHIGMLAVTPLLQAGGLGKWMLSHAECYAAESFNAERGVIAVLSARSELVAFYQRRGYQRTGAVMEYPLAAGVGLPKIQELCVEIMEKPLSRA